MSKKYIHLVIFPTLRTKGSNSESNGSPSHHMCWEFARPTGNRGPRTLKQGPKLHYCWQRGRTLPLLCVRKALMDLNLNKKPNKCVLLPAPCLNQFQTQCPPNSPSPVSIQNPSCPSLSFLVSGTRLSSRSFLFHLSVMSTLSPSPPKSSPSDTSVETQQEAEKHHQVQIYQNSLVTVNQQGKGRSAVFRKDRNMSSSPG